MAITTMTSREFNQDVSKAKRCTAHGPVFITDRGRPAYVLITIEEYEQIFGNQASIADLLAMPETADDVPFEPPRLDGKLFEPAKLS